MWRRTAAATGPAASFPAGGRGRWRRRGRPPCPPRRRPARARRQVRWAGRPNLWPPALPACPSVSPAHNRTHPAVRPAGAGWASACPPTEADNRAHFVGTHGDC